MCGRCRCTLNPEDVPRACGINASSSSLPVIQSERYRPSYNVSPGMYLPVVRKEHGSGSEPVVHCMKWGLVPSFIKKSEKPDHFKMFNARSESICEKASFRRLVPNNRCLVAAEGFYEWKKDGQKKQPYYIYFKDQRPLVFGALYDSWVNAEGVPWDKLTPASIATLQERMPVIFGDDTSKNAWLSSLPSAEVVSMLQPYEDTDLVWYPVTTMMGKPFFNGPECVKEIQLKHEEKAAIATFFSKHKLEGKTKSELYAETFSVDLDHKDSMNENANTKESESSSTPDHDASQSFEITKAGEKCGTKRDFEQFADSDVSILRCVADPRPSRLGQKSKDKSQPTVKRKSDGKSGVRNQQTLLSYFGRC